MAKEVVLTQEGLDKLSQELKELKDVRRPVVIERLQAARSLGDLSENSEYDDARNEQSFIEGRIQELQDMIKHAKIVAKHHSNGTISLGSSVVCQIEGDQENYEIVSSAEADPTKGKISVDSPLGVALIGKKKGAMVEVNAPAGVLTYKIIEAN